MYYNDHQAYPDDSSDQIVACNSGSGTPVVACSWNSIWQKDSITYMQRMPFDPVPTQNYSYCVSVDANSFLLWAELENAGDMDSSTSSDRCGVSDGSAPCFPVCSGTCYYVCGG